MTKTLTIDAVRYVAILSKEGKSVDVGNGATKEAALKCLIEKTNLIVEQRQQDRLISGIKLTKEGFTIAIEEIC